MKKLILIFALVWGVVNAQTNVYVWPRSQSATEDGTQSNPYKVLDSIAKNGKSGPNHNVYVRDTFALTATFVDSAVVAGTATGGMRRIIGVRDGWTVDSTKRARITGTAGMVSLIRPLAGLTSWENIEFDASGSDSHCVDMRTAVSDLEFNNNIFRTSNGHGIVGNTTGLDVKINKCSFYGGNANSRAIYSPSTGLRVVNVSSDIGCFINNRGSATFDDLLINLKYNSTIGIEGVGTNFRSNNITIDGTNTTGCTGITVSSSNTADISWITLTNLSVGINCNSRIVKLKGITTKNCATNLSNSSLVVDRGLNKYNFTGTVYKNTAEDNWTSIITPDTIKVGAQ